MSVENSADEGAESTSSDATPLEDLFSSEPVEKSTSAKAKDSDEEEASQKLPVSESSPDEKQDDKAKAAEKQASDAKKDAKKQPDAKTDEKKGAEMSPEEKAAQEAKAKWDNEENPYVKRYKDTAANWQKEHQEKLQYQSAISQLQQEVQTLRKIADGTYDPEVDAPKAVPHEVVAERALSVGKALASRNAAIEQYGSEEVASRLAEFNQVFESNEMINQLVINSDSPVHEAFRILNRYKFETKYGSTPDDWHKNIRAEAETELREKIKAEVTEELMGRADKKHGTPRGLSSSRGSNGVGNSQNSKGKGATPLNEIFSR